MSTAPAPVVDDGWDDWVARLASPPEPPGSLSGWTDGLSDFQLVGELRRLQDWIGHLQARQLDVVAAFTERSVFARREDPAAPDRPADTEQDRWARAAVEVSAAVSIAPSTADALVGMARDLTDELPAVLAALRDGQLTLPQAKRIVEDTRVLPPAQRAAVAAKALAAAPGLTVGKLARKLARWVLEADPAGADERAARARAGRCFGIAPAEDGMATLTAALTADGAQTVFAAVDAVAATLLASRRASARSAQAGTAEAGSASPGAARADSTPPGVVPGEADRGRADQARADALVAICRGVLDAGHTGCGNPDCGDDLRDRQVARTRVADDATCLASDTPAAVPTPDRRRLRLARRHRRRADIQVTVAATTLLGVDDLPG